ncbi:MAG TPA: acyl-CoA dehydrogenase, partial [Methylomirabilota bacterium]
MTRFAEPDGAVLARARAVLPRLESASDTIEASRRLGPAVVDALHDAALFRLLMPRFLDGGEVDPVTFVHVIEAVAQVDGSTAWCLCQAAGCSMVGAYLTPEIAREIFGPRDAVLAWGPGPDARAV